MESVQNGIPLILVIILEKSLYHYLYRGIYSIIGKPTHFTNHSSSYVDLIIASDLSLIVESGIEMSVAGIFHDDIIYGKINFRVDLVPPHFRTIWDYKNVNIGSSQRDIENFNWQNVFESKTIN